MERALHGVPLVVALGLPLVALLEFLRAEYDRQGEPTEEPR